MEGNRPPFIEARPKRLFLTRARIKQVGIGAAIAALAAITTLRYAERAQVEKARSIELRHAQDEELKLQTELNTHLEDALAMKEPIETKMATDQFTEYLNWSLFGDSAGKAAGTPPSPEILRASELAWCRAGGDLRFALGDLASVFRKQCATEETTRAIDTLMREANHDNPWAQTVLALLNKEAAPLVSFEWAQAAANQGVAAAQYLLGYQYHAGTGVPRDMHEALRWYRRAAANGELRAQTALCQTLQEADDPKDHLYVAPALRSNAEAHVWCTFAASNQATGLWAVDHRNFAASEREKIAQTLNSHQFESSVQLMRKLQRMHTALRPPV